MSFHNIGKETKVYKISSFGTAEFQELTGVTVAPCISVYLPTFTVGRETRQGAIHLKNLLEEVKKGLQEQSIRWDQMADLIGPAEALVKDSDFWLHQNHGLAVFMADGFFRVYGLPIDVPVRQTIGPSFDVTPLLPLLSNDGRFYVLALSENAVRLFDGTRFGITETSVEGLPESFSETDSSELHERRQQQHSEGVATSTIFGSGSQGSSELHNLAIKQYFDRVDSVLTPYFNEHPAPIVLAGVQHLLPIYRTANTSATILEGEIHGNQDRASAQDLHDAAWVIAEPYFMKSQNKARDRFNQLLGTTNASVNASEIETAADNGRVATLFIALNDTGSEEINRAAVATLAKGGEVFALQPEAMPSEDALAAIFRY